MGIRPAQAQPPAGPAHHLPDPRSRQRLAPLRALQLDQQHPVGRVRRILGGQVLEIGMDHRRARPPDLPATQYAVLDHPRMLGLGPALVRIELPMADVNVRRDALAAARLLPQMQVDQVQPAQLADTEPPVAQPGHDHLVPRRSQVADQRLPRAVGEHLRMTPPHRRCRAQRVGRKLPGHVPEEHPPPVGPGRQPLAVQLARQLLVGSLRSLELVEALQARGRAVQRALRVRFLPARHGLPYGPAYSAPTAAMYRLRSRIVTVSGDRLSNSSHRR